MAPGRGEMAAAPTDAVPHGDAVLSRTAAQRQSALRRANRVRLARAALKREVQDGSRCAADVVATCPPEVVSMAVGELLVAQHRWGEARALRTLRRVPVPETKPIGRMTPRQRTALVDLLGGRCQTG
ncbi:MAG: hypothetical protein AB7G37_19690 [Solirubrobacteraceae bacterium]